MSEQITIENLQQEVAALKIELEGLREEAESLKAETKRLSEARDMWISEASKRQAVADSYKDALIGLRSIITSIVINA